MYVCKNDCLDILGTVIEKNSMSDVPEHKE